MSAAPSGRGFWRLGLLLGLGYAFLYLPIVMLVLFSFNESRLVTVWAGFSLRWYARLFENARMADAALLSLTIAALSASVATVLGGVAGLALARLRRFPGRGLFGALLIAPLVLPELLIGLSLLLLVVDLDQWIGWPAQRGVATIVIAHATLTMAYVAVIVQARLARLDPAIEEAARDLGATPAKVLVAITLPMVAPALAAGWLLAFTISLDDLVIASLVGGPGSTTLPMLIYSSIRLGLDPQINALSTLILLAATSAALLASRMVKPDERT